ncbi:MAG: TIGR04283 family arsenosugar biosynthesis glycosyltransferase [Candidatus Acidiferrales bacterium]
MNQRACICVFAKPPVPGRVKTRLVPLLGTNGAAELATVFLQDTWAAASALPWAKPVLASTEEGQLDCLPGPIEIWLQGEGDLGVRLENIVRRALHNHRYAIAIGADSPGLPARFLEQAQEALARVDAVIGPCEDGGFYLLGLRNCPEGLFSGIRWSAPTTCEETIAKVRAAGLVIHVLDLWFDVDTAEDLKKLNSLTSSSQIHAPKTKDFLEIHPAACATVQPLKCSVVIPALNELEYLPRALASLEKQTWIHEVIVADGGSTDGTSEWLPAQNFVRVIDAPAGKGNQLNAGARASSGDVFLFLHADCHLPLDAGESIATRLQSPEVAGGCFEVCFNTGHSGSLKLVAAGINLRSRLARVGTGDQGIFVRRSIFEQVGGCPDWPLFEDVELVRRIKRVGRFAILRSRLLVSPRRHLARGVFRTVLLIYALRMAFWLGVSPFTLKKWYDDSRPPGHFAPETEPTPERLS